MEIKNIKCLCDIGEVRCTARVKKGFEARAAKVVGQEFNDAALQELAQHAEGSVRAVRRFLSYQVAHKFEEETGELAYAVFTSKNPFEKEQVVVIESQPSLETPKEKPEEVVIEGLKVTVNQKKKEQVLAVPSKRKPDDLAKASAKKTEGVKLEKDDKKRKRKRRGLSNDS